MDFDPNLFDAVGDLFRVGFWLVAGLAIWTFAVRRRPRRARDPLARARTVLDERYARGEIDRAEYFERRAALE